MGFDMRRTSLVFATTACALAALPALAGCSSSKQADAKKDVTVTSCTASPTGGHPTATGTILNHSSKASAYAIHVQFKDSSGNAVGDGVAAVAKVDPDTSATWHATGTVNAKGPVTCELSSVTRTVSVVP
jgi:hypothetical protein